MKSVLTIGNFDGVHRGHQALVESLLDVKRRLGDPRIRVTVVTFDPHPAEVLRPGVHVPKLSSLPEKIRLLTNLGVDEVRVVPFTAEFAQTSARAFFERVVTGTFDPVHVSVGSNFYFGQGREGTPELMMEWCRAASISAQIQPPIEVDGELVSSSRIRARLQEGAVASAARLLGHHFSLRGEVRHGDKRGRQLGFPTANLLPDADLCLPKKGVYLSSATVEGRTFASITNVGTRPTFKGSGHLSVETHLLNFDGDLYGKQLSVEFRDRIRDEMRFEGVGQLVQQIQADIEIAKSRLDII
jgi:riboflavin kinase/FMN adenylyltransferase